MTKKQDPEPNPDPLVRGVDPRIQIRIRIKISRIRNTATNTYKIQGLAPLKLKKNDSLQLFAQ